MLRALRLSLVLAAGCLLSSCDWTGLAYDHLDLLARHYLAGFVDLRPEQQAALDAGIDRVWDWHRKTELPKYAAAVRELAAVSQRTQTPAEIDAQLSKLDRLGETLSQRLLGELAPLLAQLDDAQVQQILGELDKRIEKSARREARLDEVHWRDKEADGMREELRKYAGPLEPGQEKALGDWSQTLKREPGLRARAAQAWRARFAEVLARRREPGHAERVQALAAEPDPAIGAFEHARSAMRERYVALLAAFSTDYTPQQRRHLHDSLEALAQELEQLAAEPARTAAQPAAGAAPGNSIGPH